MFITSPIRVYIYSDDEMRTQQKFDVARILVRTNYIMVLNESFNLEVNTIFNVNIV